MLIDRPMSDVEDTLTDLQTIFKIPSDESRSISLHHPTFRDFLVNERRCTDYSFWVDEKQAHRVLGDRCLALMNKKLKANMWDLPSPGTLVDGIVPGQIERCIPTDLQYACLYWAEHYRQSGIHLYDGDPISDFFKRHFLHWLEAINLMGKSAEMGAIIRLYHSLLMVRITPSLQVTRSRKCNQKQRILTRATSQPDSNERQIPFVKDARRLMFNFQNIIKQAPLQTYCSALIYVLPTNELKAHFRGRRHLWIEDFRLPKRIFRSLKTTSIMSVI